MESQKIKGIEHFVYDSIQEFRQYKGSETSVIPDWRYGQEGDWVLADDGGVVQILRRGYMGTKFAGNKSGYDYVRTVVGSFVVSNKLDMDTDFSQHPNRYTFSKKIKTNSQENVWKREDPTKRERLWCTLVAAGRDPVEEYMKLFGPKSIETARRKALVLLKQKRIIREVSKNIREIAKNLNITEEYVFDKLKGLADNSEDEEIIFKSAKQLGRYLGMESPDERQIQGGILGLFQHEITSDELEAARRPLLEEGEE